MRVTRKTKQFAIFIVDVVLLYAALWISLSLRSMAVPGVARYWKHVLAFTPLMPVWIIVFYTMRLYALETPFDDVNFIGKLAAAVGISALLTSLYFYVTPAVVIAPKTVLLIFSATTFALLLMWRYLLGRVFRSSLYKKVVAFIGLGDEAETLISELCAKPYLGYEVAFVFDDKVKKAPCGVQLISDTDALNAAFLNKDVDLAIISDGKRIHESNLALLFKLTRQRVRYEPLSAFYENVFRRIPIGTITETWFLDNIDVRNKSPYEILKRALDLFISGAILLVSLPFWPVIAIGIKVGSPGPVFFKQTRLGREGRPFTIIKFRTMRIDDNNFAPTGVADARIVAFGSFLRTTRLDELPQTLNIFHGEMSFVGPRPERPELADELEKSVPFYRQRLLVKPGLTGWDQVSGEYHSPSVEDTYKKLQYDLYYIKNLSPSLDASIFFKTIMTVLGRIGR